MINILLVEDDMKLNKIARDCSRLSCISLFGSRSSLRVVSLSLNAEGGKFLSSRPQCRVSCLITFFA